MRFLIFLAILMAFTLPLFAQSYTDSLVGGATLLSGTTYYYPDGTASNDSAWIIPGVNVEWYNLTLFVRQDTAIAASGYPRPTDFPYTVRVELIAGTRLDTFSYIGYQTQVTYYGDPDSMKVNADSTNDLYTSAASVTSHVNGYVLFNDALSAALPIDTSYYIPLPDLCRYDKHRYKVTVSDTSKIWLYETGRR